METKTTTFETPSTTWLDLAAAARYLGVHFTTLRRWADAGKVSCMRTPGGRRRFALADLERFVSQSRLPSPQVKSLALPVEHSNDLVRRHIVEHGMPREGWINHLDEIQRMKFKYSGQMLLGLLMQYNSRLDSGEVFLREAEHLAQDYGTICAQARMNVSDAVQAFLFFQHSIMDMIFETSSLNGHLDDAGKRLYQRTNDFMDALMVAMVDSFCHDKLD
ncbi:MAG: helix-turn-helix domain-containing protein [Chloroflexi bacterium]|nr:helix-turn-helix domain-containing protein [Chloroflexota bacterium]